MRGRIRWIATALVGALVACLAIVAPAAADPQATASSLQSDPVQSIGVPPSNFSAMAGGQLAALRAEIAKLDPGRMWILVVSPRSFQALASFADPVYADLPAGTFIAVAEDAKNPDSTNYWVGCTWEDTAETQLNDVINGYHKGQGSLFDDLRLEIQSFAKSDAAAGHPPLSSGSSSTQPTPSTSQPAPTGTHAASGGGGNAGLIVVIVAGVMLLLVGAVAGGKYARGAARISHRRKLEAADAHDQAQADFVKLGDQIEALDIDSSMPGASQLGKEEYAQALECYQEAERRMRQASDDYQFEHAVAAIKRGLDHLSKADRLFNPPQPPAAPAPRVATKASAEPDDLVGRLQKLSALHGRGVLTDEEFAAEKAKLLEG